MEGLLGYFLKKKSQSEKDLTEKLKSITGIKPGNVSVYQIALSHSSLHPSKKEKYLSNERLEFLGDAVLGAIIAELLFKKYPFKDEGFLTEMRSRMVNREAMGELGLKLGLDKMVSINAKDKRISRHVSVYGNAMEALIGAIFMDQGYKKCKKFVIEKLIEPHFDLHALEKSESNFKSKLIEWAQKNGKKIVFEITDEQNDKTQKQFTAAVNLENTPIATGTGKSKKKAEQDAARIALEKLEVQ